jgi:hypothetical protein
VEAPLLTAERITGTLGYRLTLVLPLALLALKLITESVQIFECDEHGRFGHKVLNTPMLSLSGTSQQNLWQSLFNQIGWLLRCCPPCDLDTWTLLKTHTGDFYINDLEPFQAIRLVLRSDPFPEINAWYHKQNIHKLGELRFVYEDHLNAPGGFQLPRRSELMFWNSQDQLFKVEGSNVKGLEVSMEHPKEYEIWVQKILPDVPLI